MVLNNYLKVLHNNLTLNKTFIKIISEFSHTPLIKYKIFIIFIIFNQCTHGLFKLRTRIKYEQYL